MTREEKIRNYISEMDDDDFVELYNVYAENGNMERAYKTEEALELFPIEEGKTVQEVFYEWSSVLNENGNPKYEYIIYGVYGWEHFERTTYEYDVATDIVADNILPRDLPNDIKFFLQDLDYEEEDD